MSGKVVPWIGVLSLLFFSYSLYGGLVAAPADYQQGDSFRIIYVHVPSAWLSMLAYGLLATCGAISLIWRIKVADALARAIAPIGASYTFLALASGSIWGKPMWGTWWVWDARLTSVAILFIVYLLIIFLNQTFENREVREKTIAIFILIGSINLPIIKFSVDWWNTLHQTASVSKLSSPSIDMSMLQPLLMMTIGFSMIGMIIAILRIKAEILLRKKFL